MGAIYLTALGGLYNGDGINISSVSVGDNGWIYLAGVDNSNDDSSPYKAALTVIAYKDGQLAWKKDFQNNSNRGTFEAITYKNGSVYAAGAISIDFNGEDLAVNGNTPVVAPEKMPTDQATLDYYSNNSSMLQEPTYSVYVKLDGETGAVESSNVIPSPYIMGDDRLRSIDVDSNGNIYVAGGGWNHGPDFDTSSDNEYYWNTTKFSSAGNQIWKVNGETVVLNPFTGEPYLTRWGSQIISLDTANGADSETFDTEFKSNPNGEGNWIRGWLFDADGNIYVLAGRMSWDNVKSNLDQRGVVAKINASTNSVEWETTFGIDADSCLPNSMTFTPNGRLLISGEVSGTLEGETGFGGKDGFLLEINTATGDIESSEIIGSANNESISQIKFQNILNDSTGKVFDHNLIIGGSFEVNRYSLEGGSESDIYLITDQGFELIGNALNNYMQGGGGDDHISSGAGNDILVGGLGNDILDGGTGSDTANYSADANRLVINLETGVAKGNGSDTLVLIDNVVGGRASDTITGNDASNEITSGAGNDVVNAGGGDDLIVGGDGAGNDTYNGGTGIDTIKYTSAKSGITVNLSASKDQAKSTLSGDKAGIGVDQLSGIENIIAGKYDDLLTGNSADNLIDGGSGTSIDKIDGSAGTDTVSFASLVASSASIPGVTLDLSSAKDSSDYVTASGLGGADKIKNIENVTGSKYADTFTGNSADNLIDGGSGTSIDKIDGSSGTDTVSFASLVASSASASGVTLNLASAKDSNGYVTASGLGGADKIKNIENVTGSSYADTLTGDSRANTFSGSSGNDLIDGGSGTAADTIDGGAATDTISFASLTASSATAAGVSLNLASIKDSNGYMTTSGLGGADKIKNIENVTGSQYADILTGNSGANTLDGGAGIAVDKIDGGSGTDTVSFASLTASSATAAGVTLNLTAVLTSGDARGYSLASGLGGADWVKDIENITGSSYADILTGNDANNVISGGAGADKLTGGKGVDKLYGGSNDGVKDIFDFNAASESTSAAMDLIYDFVSGKDKIDLSSMTPSTNNKGAFLNNPATVLGTTYKANSVWITKYDTSGTANDYVIVSADLDGKAGADFAVRLIGINNIVTADIVL